MEIILITKEDLKAMIEDVLAKKMPELLKAKPPENLMTTAEAAAYLRVNIRTIRRWAISGRIKCKKPGHKALYLKEDLDNVYR